MIAFGVGRQDLEAAAAAVGVRLEGVDARGRGLKFVLRPLAGEERFRKVTPMSGRRVFAVCWHGHLAFFRALFAACPAARVKSASADYRGQADFLASFGGSDRQEGSTCTPWMSSDCCRCGEE